ncbi:MAG: autotransporter outer membrane beta-barrel domain-containing protein [Planctomycetaceae bacterium]|nr:autotransporter outer membrane beta-barrel domain-containing protein [Planctomycetaceae bacterium]
MTFVVCGTVCCTGSGQEMPETPETDSPFFAEHRLFSADADLYLGQKTRRRGGSGGRIWGNLYYGGSTLRPQDTPKIQPVFYGFQLGFDAVKSYGGYSTYFLNVNQSDTKSALVSNKIENYFFGLGQFYYLRYCHFGYTAAGGYDRYETAADGIKGNGDGLQANLFGEFGIDILLGKWALRPYYALQYDFLYHGRIGSSPAVLYQDWNGHGFEQLMGLRTDWQITNSLTVQARATWVRELLSSMPPYYHLRFSPMQGVQTPAIMFFEGNTGRDWAWLGGGIKLEKEFNIITYLDYDVLVNTRHVTHLGSFGVCLNW